MTTFNIDLPERLAKHLVYLETISKKPKEFILKEALVQFLEHAEDVAKYYQEEKEKGDNPNNYSTKNMLEEINLK
jgi:predicted DNA-binding protein